MANSIEIETYPAEDKWSPNTTHVSGVDSAPLSKTIKAMSLETYHAGTTTESNKVSVQIGGNSEREREFNAEQVRELLKASGFHELETKSLGSNISIIIERVPGANPLVAVAHGLGADLNGPNGTTTYSQLGARVIDEIEQNHLTTTGKTPSEAGLVTIKAHARDERWHADRGLTGQQVATIDAELPRGPIASIREDITFAQAAGKPVAETTSRIEMRDWGSQNIAAEALREAGLKTKVLQDKGVAFLQVEGTADQVASALAEKKILAPHVAQDIAGHAQAAHPEAQEINRAVARETQTRHAPAAPAPLNAQQQQQQSQQRMQQQQDQYQPMQMQQQQQQQSRHQPSQEQIAAQRQQQQQQQQRQQQMLQQQQQAKAAPQQVITPEALEGIERMQVRNDSIRTLQQLNLDASAPFEPKPVTALDMNGKPTQVGITSILRDPETQAITAVEYINPKDSADKYAVQKYTLQDGVMVLPTSTEGQAAELSARIHAITGNQQTVSLEQFDHVLKSTHAWYQEKGLVPDMYNSNTSKFAYDAAHDTFGSHETSAPGVYRRAGGTQEVLVVRGAPGEQIAFNAGSEHVGTQYGKGEVVLLRDNDGGWRKLDSEYARENLRHPDGSAIQWDKAASVQVDALQGKPGMQQQQSPEKARPAPSASAAPAPAAHSESAPSPAKPVTMPDAPSTTPRNGGPTASLATVAATQPQQVGHAEPIVQQRQTSQIKAETAHAPAMVIPANDGPATMAPTNAHPKVGAPTMITPANGGAPIPAPPPVAANTNTTAPATKALPIAANSNAPAPVVSAPEIVAAATVAAAAATPHGEPVPTEPKARTNILTGLPKTSAEVHAGRAGAALGALMAIKQIADGMGEKNDPAHPKDALTQTTQIVGNSTAGVGIVQSGTNIALTVVKNEGALKAALGAAEGVASKTGVVGAVAVGALVTVHGIRTGNKDEIAEGVGGTAGALAGAEAGATAGAAAGAAVGAFFFGAGAAPGAVIGGLVGGIGGGIMGSHVGKEAAAGVMYAYEHPREAMARIRDNAMVIAAANPVIGAPLVIADAVVHSEAGKAVVKEVQHVAHEAHVVVDQAAHRAKVVTGHAVAAVSHAAADVAHKAEHAVTGAVHTAQQTVHKVEHVVQQTAKAMFDAADANHDGKVSWMEAAKAAASGLVQGAVAVAGAPATVAAAVVHAAQGKHGNGR